MSETSSVLLTDLYQLTMLQAYYVQGMQEQATFEMYVRRLPPNRNFLMAAGLEQVLEYLENLRFAPGNSNGCTPKRVSAPTLSITWRVCVFRAKLPPCAKVRSALPRNH